MKTSIQKNRLLQFLIVLFVILVVSLLLFNHFSFPNSSTLDSLESLSETDARIIEAREKMISDHLIARGIYDERVLEAMRSVPRHLFVDEKLKYRAYEDNPLPIGEGQTISQPYIVALMTQSLNLTGNETVLEIGTGSGYQAAILSELVNKVYTIEIRPTLAARANQTLKNLGYDNVEVKNADGYFGWPEKEPFDAIMITAAVDHISKPLVSQLKDRGLLILPLGNVQYYQTLTLVKKQNGNLTATYITNVRFVPLVEETQI